jgi:AraC-like DNA-binding protein
LPQQQQSQVNCANKEARTMTVEPLVRANVLAAFPAYVGSRGLDFVSLLNEVGLQLDEVKEPETLVSLNRVGRLFDNVAIKLGDPAFGIHYAEHFPQGATGLLGYLVLSAPTVRTSLSAAAEFLAVQTIPVDASFVEQGGLGYLRWSFSSAFREPRVQFTGFTAAAFLLRLRFAAGTAWEPLTVNFDHGAPEALRAYKDFFGARVRFDQPDCGLVLDATVLSLPMRPQPLPVFAELKKLGMFVLTDLKQKGAVQARWDDMTMAQRAQVEIERRLDGTVGENFDQPSIAEALGLSARQLQWELNSLETSYDKILVGIRTTLAERYLRETDQTLSQISTKLGFSEASAFTRWARRTFGQSPSAQRDLLRSGAPTAQLGNDFGSETGDDS